MRISWTEKKSNEEVMEMAGYKRFPLGFWLDKSWRTGVSGLPERIEFLWNGECFHRSSHEVHYIIYTLHVDGSDS